MVLDSDHRYGLRLGPLFMRGRLKCGIRLDSHSRCIQIALPNYTRIQEPAVDHCGLFACWHGVASTAACLCSLHVAGYLGPCARALGQDDKRFLTVCYVVFAVVVGGCSNHPNTWGCVWRSPVGRVSGRRRTRHHCTRPRRRICMQHCRCTGRRIDSRGVPLGRAAVQLRCCIAPRGSDTGSSLAPSGPVSPPQPSVVVVAAVFSVSVRCSLHPLCSVLCLLPVVSLSVLRSVSSSGSL